MSDEGVTSPAEAKVIAAVRTRKVFECSDCLWRTRDWRTQCGSCGFYNTLSEKEIPLNSHVYVPPTVSAGSLQHAIDGEVLVALPPPIVSSGPSFGSAVRLADVAANVREPDRIATGIEDLDFVLGTNSIDKKTGAVRGTAIMLGGEPGVGKSTLLTQLAGSLAKQGKVFYGAGEESTEQVGMRANRLGIFKDPRVAENFYIVQGSDTDSAKLWIREHKPILAIIDSAQVFTTGLIDGRAGGVSQVVNNHKVFFELAHESGTIIFLINHVTKGGEFAGPQTAKHWVDVSLMLLHHGDTGNILLVSDGKNRFGDINDCGTFRMTEKGLKSIS